MTTKDDIQRWFVTLNQAIATVADKKKRDEVNVLIQKGMQPQQSQQFVPMQRGLPGQTLPYSPQTMQAGGSNQTTTIQPDLMQVLAKIAQDPNYTNQVSPLIQNQYHAAQAAKAPWMETPRGGMQTNVLTGKQLENPVANSMSGLDKKLSERISPDNHKFITMIRPDNTRYEFDSGEVPQGSIGAGERPYFQTVTDRDGAVKVFDTRKGRFVDSPNDVIKPAPTEVRMFVSALDNNLSSIKNIRDISNRGDLTGVVSGRARKFGTRFFSDAEAQQLRSRVGQLRTIIYGLSGKQINESEQKWLYDEILPNMSNPTENFEVALDEFEKWVKTKKGELIKQFPNIKDIQTESNNPSPTPTPTGTGKFKILKVE